MSDPDVSLPATAREPALPASRPLHEEALARRARDGDREAFAAIVMPHLPEAMRLARRVLRHAAYAEDLVQDATLRALERLAQYDPARPFRPWFLRLLFRLGLHRHEARALRAHDSLDDVRGAAARPTDDAERGELREAIDMAVAALPPRQRTILLLYDADGYSGAEIADLLGIAPETVRWHLHAARRAIRPALQSFRPETHRHE